MTKEQNARLQELAAKLKPALDDETTARAMLADAVQRQRAIYVEMRSLADGGKVVVTFEDVAAIITDSDVSVAPNIVADAAAVVGAIHTP